VNIRLSNSLNVFLNVISSFEIIDKNRSPVKPQLFIANSQKIIIGKLSEAYNIELNVTIGQVNELSFDIPYKIDFHHQWINNPNIEKAKYKYLVKLVLDKKEEWYVIDKPPINNIDEEGSFLHVHCFSLPYELTEKLINNYEVVSYNLRQILEGHLSDDMPGILSSTNWHLGYIDAVFEITYRSYKTSSKTALDCLLEMVKKFNGLILWDTVNREINIYQPHLVGIDRGLIVSYGKYLRTLKYHDLTENMVTRLKVFGNNNLSINRINPTGVNYIEDFSFFLYPFQRDENKNIVEHSNYMTDKLCHAQLDYEEKIESATGQFQDYLEQKKIQEEILIQLNNDLTNLLTELDVIIDSIFVESNAGHNVNDLVNQRIQKEQEINSKYGEIDNIENIINDIDNQILTLKQSLSLENNFTPELLAERIQFIIEKEWRDTNYINDEELYKDAKKHLEEMRKPQIDINIDIINFLDIIEEQYNWDKLNLGDVITVHYEYLGLKVKSKIVGVKYNFEDSEIVLSIADVKKVEDEFDKWLDYVGNTVSTSTEVDINQFKWGKVERELGIVGQIMGKMWNDVKEELDMAFNETVITDGRGITIVEKNDPLRFIRMTHGIIGLTRSGGNRYETAITPDGIIAERLMGLIILGERVVASDPDGILVINGNKITISDRDNKEVMWMGLIDIDPDRFGLRLINNVNRITLDDLDGFTIEKKNGLLWEKKFFADTNGSLFAYDMTAKRLTITNDEDTVLFDSYENYIDFSKLETMIIDGKLTPQEKLSLRSEWKRIQAEKEKIVDQANNYMYIEREDETGKQLQQELNDYLNAYNALNNILPILLDDSIIHLVTDINDTVGITRDQFIQIFEEYYSQAIRMINSITNILKKSSLQLGRNYNNTVIDAISGIVVTRMDGVVKTTLNATEGILIERLELGSFVKKFYVDTYGVLNAEDLVAKRLILYNDRDRVVLDANSKLFDLNETQLIGQVNAENIIGSTFIQGIGFVANLTVNRLLSIDVEKESSSDINYIDIKNNKIVFNHGTLTQGSQAQQTINGISLPLYWIIENGKRISTTIDTSDLTKQYEPVYEYIIQDPKSKLMLTFNENEENKPVEIILGLGNGIRDQEKGYISKRVDGLNIEYVSPFYNDVKNIIKLYNNGIDVFANSGHIGLITRNATQKQLKHIDSENESINFPIARILTTTGNFAGTTGSVWTFNNGTNDIDLGHINYGVIVTPIGDHNGYVGEIYITKNTGSVTVKNTGSSTGQFSLTIIF